MCPIRSRLGGPFWVAVATGAVIILAAGLSLLPVQSWVLAVGERLQAFGLLGIVLFGAIYVFSAMALVPASALSFAAGLLYGPLGILVSWAAMMIVAAISFPLSRYLLAAPVRRLVSERARLRTVAEVIDEEGWRMVLLVRVSGFLPFGLQNYVLGVTNIRFVPFLLASSVGFLPSILVYAGSGAFGSAISEAGSGPLRIAFLALAILAGLTLVAITARKVHTRLADRRFDRGGGTLKSPRNARA